MTTVVNHDICIGCGMCEQTAPEVFRLENGTAVVQCGVVPPHAEQEAKTAMAECPVQAIGIND